MEALVKAVVLKALLERAGQQSPFIDDDVNEVVRAPGGNWEMQGTDSDCALKSGTMSSATGKQATFHTKQLVEVGFHNSVICDMCFRKGVATRFKCAQCDDYGLCLFCNRDNHRHNNWRLSLGGNFHEITFKMESDIDDLIAFGVKPLGAPRAQGVGIHDDSHGFYFTSGSPVKVVRGRDNKRWLGSVGLAKGDRVTLVLHHSKLECYHTSGTTHVHVGTMDNVSNIYRFAVTITKSGQKVSVVDTPARLCTGATAVVTSDERWLAIQSRLRNFIPKPTGMTGVIATLDDEDDSAGLSVDGIDKLLWVPQNCLNMRARGELACTLKEGDTVVRHPGDSGWRWGGQDGGAGNTGKVVKATDDSGWVSVKWGNGETKKYRYGGDGKFDVMLRVEVGSRVVRNPFHWKWGNQDAGGVGTVERIDTTKDRVHVKWGRSSRTYHYRLSRTHADVQVAAPSTRLSSPPASPVAAEPQHKAAPAARPTARELTCSAFDVNWKRPLGEGAFGKVYSGSYEQEPVAIKVVNAVPNEVVMREVQALFEMNHPRIAKVFGYHFDSSQRRTYIVMERLMHDVASVIKAGRKAKRSPCVPWGEFYRTRRPCVPWSKFYKLVLGTSLGLREMHRQQYMHRDIKPQNIMVGKDGFPKLVDMGLAKQVLALHTMQVNGATFCGTPCYMAPEVFMNQGGSAADVYALGCTGWEMVDGRVPKSWCSHPLEMAVAEMPMEEVEQAGTKRSVVDLLRNMTALEADQRPKLDEVVRTLEQEQHS